MEFDIEVDKDDLYNDEGTTIDFIWNLKSKIEDLEGKNKELSKNMKSLDYEIKEYKIKFLEDKNKEFKENTKCLSYEIKDLKKELKELANKVKALWK